MASGRKAKEFEHQFTLSQEQRDEYRQALAQQTTQADVQKVYDDAKAQVQSYWNKPVSPADYTQRIDAWRRYQAATNYIKGYTQLTGQLTEQNFQNWYKGIQAEYEKAAQREGQALQLSGRIRQNPTKALGLQTAAGLRVDDAALRDATTANKLPGLLDEKTGLPTETAWAAWEKNRLRTAYQDAAQTAGQQQAAIAQRQKQQTEETERLEGVQNVLWRLLDAKEPQLVRYHDAIVKQQAKLAGISNYQDAADLQRQVETRLGRLGRIQDRTAARAADKAGEVRTARALEYQLDNPSESLDANALKWERDQAAREAAQGLTLHSAANFLRANNAYAQQRYTDEKWKDISAIRNDPTLSGDYQTALEATRTANAAEEALGYLKSDLRRDGAVTRDTAMQARHIASQAGITLPDDDAALEGFLARLTKQEGARLQYALAGLTAAGYDEEKLQQYIKQALNAQQMDEYTASARESAAAHPVGTSLASSAANLVGGMGYLAALPRTVKNTWSAATGNYDAYIPIDENADSFRATKYAQTVREEVARQLQEKYPDGEFLGQNTAAFLYDTGMSMLDNILQVGVGMGLLGAPAMAEAAASGGVSAAVAAGSAAASPVSLGMMGLTTASQKLLEMTDEGVDTTTAYNLATAAGAIEVLTEKIGLDEFINGLGRQTAATTLRRIGQQVGRQTLAEGTEEAASDVLNLAADLLLRMDQADFVRDIDRARRQGLSKGEAVWSVVEDQLKQTGVSFAGGALSGALFGLGGAAMNAVSSTDRAMGRQIQRTGGMEQLQKDAAAYGLNADNLTRESSPKELGAMQRQVYRAAEQTAGEIEAFAKQKGYKKAAADALQAAWQGYKETGLNALSPQEFGVAFDTAYQEGRLDAQYGQTGAYLERAATDALTAGLLPETVKYAYLAGTKDGGRAAKRTQSPVHALRERAAERRARRADASEAAATGAAQPSGGLTVMQLDDYTAKLRTAEGKTVTADQMETDAPERQIILQAQDDGYGPQEANALLAHYDGSMAPEAYYEQFREAITAGQDGESLTEARRRAGSGLTAEATKAAWELGQEIQTFLDTDERVGPAGKQALDAMAYGDAGLFEAYYKAGLAGESFAEARGRIGQMTDALEAKLRAAVKAGARDAQGGFSYGKQEPNRDAGRGRVHDLGTGGQDGAVERVAEADAGGEGPAVAGTARRADAANPGEQKQEVTKNIADADGAAIKAQAGELVSARELGIGNGTERKTLRVIRPEALTQEQRAEKERLREKGITLTFVEGRIELTGPDDATHYAKGVCVKQKNAIVVRTDAKMPWRKIVRHEAQHMEFERDPQLLATRWNEFVDHLETEQIDRWVAGYAERYGGLYDAADLDALIEEALCDYAADVEAPEATERYWREVFPKQKETWKEGRNISDAALYRLEQDAGGQKNSARAGGRASIAETEKERYDYKKSFAEQLEDWRAGRFPKYDTFVLGATPEVFSKIGLNALPMTINQRHIDYALNGTKNADHELSLPDLKQLPRALENPIAIIHSPQKPSTSLIAIIQMRSKNGKQVISAVYVDGAGTYNGKVIDSNAVTTIHGRNNAARMLAQAIQLETQGATAVYWLDKKRSQSLLQGSSSQLTTPLIHDGLYHSIRESGARVNGKIENVTQSLQFKRWFGDWEKNPNRASKVVNEDGTPKVVYHGTNQEFHTFQSQNGAYFFSESQDYAESMAEERGGDRVVQAYLDMRRPLRVEMQPGEFSDPNYEAKYLREAKAKGHDGVIFTLRTGNELVDDTFYAVFDSAQIKSATENIGTFDQAEQDIRYSAEDDEDAADWTAESQDLADQLEDAQKRNKALEAVNRKLREQMKVTPPDTADQRELRGAAKRLAENYGGGLRQKDLTKQLQSIWRLRAEAQRGSEENRREKRGQMNEELEQLAAELTRNYLDKDNPEAETLREIRRIVRTTKIQLTPELRGDLDREGGYQDFRRRNFGRIRLANSGVGVDQLYQELSEQWPAYFPASIWNSADQLMQIADVIQDGTTILARSPYGDQDGMQYMKTRILWELGAVPAAQPTLADQAAQGAYREEALRRGGPGAGKEQLIDATAAHEQEQMDQLDAWYRDHLRKVKADREDQIQKVKDRYQERAQAERDRKAEQELKRRLLWHGNRLKRMGRTATPAQQAEIGKIIGEINLACQNMTKTTVVRDYIQGMSTESIPADGYRDKADPRRTMSAEEAAQNPEMRGDKVVDVSELKAWYEEQKKSNPDFIADRRVEEILANMDKKQIGEMTPREVQQLLDVALNIENEIRTQKKLIDAADRREVYQQVLEVIGDIESTRGRGDRNLPKVIGAVKDGGRWLVDGTLTPVRLLRRFTGYQDSDPLYRAALALQQGELKQLDYQRRAYARFEGFTKDRKFMDYLAGKGKQKPIEITGMNERGEQVTCRITPDMRVALYLHSKNYQNLRHIQRGGIEVPNYAAYVAGRYTDAYDKATRIRLAPGTVRAIGETMTTREKNYAEAIRKYYNTMSKAEINAVSVKLKGYEVAKVGEYYPIATNRDFVVKEFDAIKYDGSLESFGFLKERKEGGTPILLADATRTLERSIQSHSAYIGMAIPMRNFNKLRGVSIMDSTEAGEVRYQKQSLMDTLRKQWGTKAVERLETMVADLSGSKPRESGMGMLNRIRSNYAGAVLELNPSTGMKQLIAYPSAASVLGWDAMAVGLTKWQRVDVKLIGRYTPLLWHRMQGFIDADLGDFAKNHGHRPKFLNWNQAGDLAVVKQIWKAAEWKVAHENPALLHDVEAWHKATAEFFNRVVLESQANYTTMERGELLRTNNVFWRSITMFKTEPFQAFNVLYDGFANVAAKRRQLAAAQQLENEEGGKEKVQAAEAAYRETKKRVAQAVPAVIASNLLEAAITFAWALFRGKDKDWRDEESDEITAASFFKKLFIQAGSNIAGIVPLGGQLSEAAQAAIFGDRYYGMETTEVSIIDDTINSLLHIRGSIANMIEAGKTEEEAERARKVRAARDDFFKTLWDESMRLSVSIGVPVGNGEKILKGIFRWAFIAAMGKSEGEYWFRYCTEKSTASGRGSADADALFRAALDGDEESMDRMYAAMAKTKSEDSIQAAMRKRTKDAVDSGDVDLETAVGILQRLQTDKAADDLYWDVRGWQYMAQTGAESFGKYNILKDALRSGGDVEAALKELEEHGIERDAAITQMHSQIGAWYTGTSDDGKTIQKTEALQLLQKYGDENEREAEETVREWTCEKETGYAYSELSAAMVDGEITKEQAVDWLQRYGGKEKEAAQSTVKKWTCEKETGYAYGELREALQDGEVTEKNVAKWLQQYGGKDEEDATQQAAAWVFAGKHPELADKYGDEALESIANSYAKYGAGIPAAQFAKYKQDLDKIEGDPDGEGGYKRNTRKPKVYAYIAQLPLTPEQKDSLVHVASGSYNLKGTPW